MAVKVMELKKHSQELPLTFCK